MRVAALIPAKNEERMIGKMVSESKRYVDLTIVVIDAYSEDRTEQEAELAGAHSFRASKPGKGSALAFGFSQALRMNVDVVVTIDGDGQYDPVFIPLLLEDLPNSSLFLVNGSRLLDSHNQKVFPRSRLYGNILVADACSYSLGVRITDALSGLRAYSRGLLESFRISSNGFGVDLELLFKGCLRQCVYVERPIQYHYEEEHNTIPSVMLYEVTRSLAENIRNLKGDSDPVYTFFIEILNGIGKKESLHLSAPRSLSSSKQRFHFGYLQSSDSYTIS